ncbi:MAG: hypothetical protein Kow0069_06710 [Promethearchaeota archaeon]
MVVTRKREIAFYCLTLALVATVGTKWVVRWAATEDQFDVIQSSSVELRVYALGPGEVATFEDAGLLSRERALSCLVKGSEPFGLELNSSLAPKRTEATFFEGVWQAFLEVRGDRVFSRGDARNESVGVLITNEGAGDACFNVTFTRMVGKSARLVATDYLVGGAALLAYSAVAGLVALVAPKFRDRVMRPDDRLADAVAVFHATFTCTALAFHAWVHAGWVKVDSFSLFVPTGAALAVLCAARGPRVNVMHRTALAVLLMSVMVGYLALFEEQIGKVYVYHPLLDAFTGESLPALLARMALTLPVLATGTWTVASGAYLQVWRAWKYGRTRHYKLVKHQRKLAEQLRAASSKLEAGPLPGRRAGRRRESALGVQPEGSSREMYPRVPVELAGDERGAGGVPPTWKALPFVRFVQNLGFKFQGDLLPVARDDLGAFYLHLRLTGDGFDLVEKPLWLPAFCAHPLCPRDDGRNFDVPFNACLVTKVAGYASGHKFTPREVEILSVALFLRDATCSEVTRKITEGTIHVRHPGTCRGCPNTKFIREEGPADVAERPPIEEFIRETRDLLRNK